MTTVDGKPIDYSGLPEGLRGGMRRYIEERIPTGDFLHFVLTNNLHFACMHADDDNLPRLRDLVQWLHWSAPVACYGSPAKVKEWLSKEDE